MAGRSPDIVSSVWLALIFKVQNNSLCVLTQTRPCARLSHVAKSYNRPSGTRKLEREQTMNAKYYENLAAEAHVNPSYWFDGIERKHLPNGYRGEVAKDATRWDLWNGILAVLDDAASGKRGARKWVISTFADFQDQEVINQLSENEDSE